MTKNFYNQHTKVMKKSFAVVISLGILVQANVFADTKLVRPIQDTQSMIHENNDLSADVFLQPT